MHNLKKIIGLGITGVTLLLGVPWSWAEESGAGAVTTTVSDPTVQKKVDQLKKLREENPEEFARLVGERKAKIKEKLQELKEKNPEKFQEVRENIHDRRFGRLRRLKQEDPEKFEEFMKNHPQARERWDNRRQWLAGNPGAGRREDVRDRKENFSGRREDRRDLKDGGGFHGRRASGGPRRGRAR